MSFYWLLNFLSPHDYKWTLVIKSSYCNLPRCCVRFSSFISATHYWAGFLEFLRLIIFIPFMGKSSMQKCIGLVRNLSLYLHHLNIKTIWIQYDVELAVFLSILRRFVFCELKNEFFWYQLGVVKKTSRLFSTSHSRSSLKVANIDLN